MMETSRVELGSVQETLLLPLWGRAVETRKPNPLLVDETATRIIAALDYDFSTIARNISPITRLAWIARSLHIDQTIKKFLEAHPDATLVNLGCGLDTTFQRIDNGRLSWYDLDFPDVMDLRRRFIPESPRSHSVASSILDESWLRELAVTDSIFFVAAGVLYYLEESQVRQFLIKIADVFPGAEIVFDACSPGGMKLANKKVIKAGGMDQRAVLKWGLREARDLESWDHRIVVASAYPIFRNFRRGLSIRERFGTMLADALRIMSMVHLRLGRPPQAAKGSASFA